MPKIKLIKVYDVTSYHNYCETGDERDLVRDNDDLSTWEDVSDEQLEWLTRWEGRDNLRKNNTRIVILEDITDKKTIDGFISNIKKFVKDEITKQKELDDKKAAAEAKRKAAVAKSKIARAKRVLEEWSEFT